MKTLQTFWSLASSLVIMVFACFSGHFATAQDTTGSLGQGNDSAETLAANHIPATIANEEATLILPKFDQDNTYKDIETYLIEEMNFPTDGIESGRSGMVKVRFQIDKNGSMRQIKFIESPGPSFENEIVKTLDNAPKWTPAKKGGLNAPMTYQLNINFKLQ